MRTMTAASLLTSQQKSLKHSIQPQDQSEKSNETTVN